ncbi:MAG: hypothetical protein CML29_12620 [Rhizobiales bacterium]|nr:hypothetical protein [Hyphomicrobiales bacterium]MBA70157.1 hypothetical protein [Hyphomicrobiales bacterium]|tara:strand:- start:274 stop:1014 length:741 start_codon:yes stop_codon:yes gene_type:complete
MSTAVADRLWQFGYRTLIRRIYKFQRKRHTPHQAYRETMRVVASSRLARFLHARQPNIFRLDLLNFTALHLHRRMRADGMTILDFVDADPARFASLLNSSRKAIVLGVHNGYALCSTLLAPHKRIMTLTNSESYARHLLEISGCNDTSGIVLSGSTERPLARFLKDRELDVYDALFDAGNFDVDLHDKLNRPALRILLKADADLYFVRFDFNPDGTVIPVFHGPVEERTPQALEEFISQFYPQRYD